MPRGSSHESR
jgi:hypothetical protein